MKEKKECFTHMLKKAIHGMLDSALLFHEKLKADSQHAGFEVNPHDPCVANKIVRGKQLTVVWHADDLKISHKSPQVVTDFIEWLDSKCGDPNVGKMKAIRGEVHDCLAMNLDYTKPRQVTIDMTKCVKAMVKEFPEHIKRSSPTPATGALFDVNDSPKLDAKRAETFHAFVAKALFVAKRLLVSEIG